MNIFKQRSAWSVKAFGCSVKDLARAGEAPHVLLDSLRFLAARGLTTPALFSSLINKRQLLVLKESYDHGRRALRGSKAAALDPCAVANLLLLWLSGLPEPLFPAEHIPELLNSLRSPDITRAGSLITIRTLLKKTEPFIVEALYPLFELLHHYWINQPGRESTLADLASTFATPVFGSPEEHGMSPDAADAFVAATELLISEYRPLFTQPYNLQRYEQDLARQAAAAASKMQNLSQPKHNQLESILVGRSPPVDFGYEVFDLGSPLLTPRRLSSLSIMDSTGFFGAASPESSAWCAYIAQQEASVEEPLADIDMSSVVDQLLESAIESVFLPTDRSSMISERACIAAAGGQLVSPMSVVDTHPCNASDGSESLDGSSREGSDSERDPAILEEFAASLASPCKDASALSCHAITATAC